MKKKKEPIVAPAPVSVPKMSIRTWINRKIAVNKLKDGQQDAFVVFARKRGLGEYEEASKFEELLLIF